MTTPMVAYVLTGLALPVISTATVALHELGHCAAARAAGVRVYAFDIGRGKILCSWRWSNTRFHIRALPFLGGSVTLRSVGDGAAQQPTGKRIRHPGRWTPNRTSIEAQHPLAQAGIALAGIGVNTAIGLSALLMLLLLWLRTSHAHGWNVPPFVIFLIYVAVENLYAAGINLKPLPRSDGAQLLTRLDATVRQRRDRRRAAKALEVVSRSCLLVVLVLIIALVVLLVLNLQALIVQHRFDTIESLALIVIVLTMPSGSPQRSSRRTPQATDLPGRRGHTGSPQQRTP